MKRKGFFYFIDARTVRFLQYGAGEAAGLCL